MSGKDEMFEIIDEAGNVIGLAPRSKCHGDPSLLHRTAHVVVIHPGDGSILLQHRSPDKDIQPGKWDTAVGGHLMPGEDYSAAAKRELSEELGYSGEAELEFLFDSKIRNSIESENTRVFRLVSAGPFEFQKSEIDFIRFWSPEEIRKELAAGADSFTPNLALELKRLLDI